MIVEATNFSTEFLRVRQQGRRNTCLAFATTAAHERLGRHAAELCVEYLYFKAVEGFAGWTPNHGVTIQEIGTALAAHGQPAEAAWPYSDDHPDPWSPPSIEPPFHVATLSDGPTSFAEITETLDQSRSLVLGLAITRGFETPDSSGEIEHVQGDQEIGGHAVLAVGHGKKPGGSQYLLIRNSWGIEWGLRGHAWLSQDYVQRHILQTALIG